MSFAEQEKVRRARAEKIGLFRYALIREAADPALTARARGALVRQLAAAEHLGPFGAPVRVSRRVSTGGSSGGAPAGSTPWSRSRAAPRRVPTRRCWSWRSRSSGRTRPGMRCRSAGS